MLRTHSELGYKQEQRFHLELGLLKMAHAQKLIPIEQLLSDVAISPASGSSKPSAASSSRPAIVSGSGETRRPEPTPAARPNHVSPFAADSARKGTPRQESALDAVTPPGPRIVATASVAEPVILGSAAPATQREVMPVTETSLLNAEIRNADVKTEVESVFVAEVKPAVAQLVPEEKNELAQASAAQPEIDRLQAAVLQALADGNQRFISSILSAGEWSVQANELIIKVSESQTVIDMSLGSDAKRLVIASASGVLGRAVKLKIIPGATVAPQEGNRNGGASRAGLASSGIGGRGRAEQDPIVRRMQEKFGAEIRTVIDYKEKR
jgi:DNA polymerase III subunit gamma/tau